MTLLQNVIDYLNSRKICFVEKFFPFYVCAACCHLVNIENKKNQFYVESGALPDLRMQMFFVSPAGFSKSFVLKALLAGPTSVFGGSLIPSAFSGSMTEAAFTGTVRFASTDDEPVVCYGAAHEYSEHLVGIEEFSALTVAMKQEHSSNLDNALLTALDSGRMIKRLAAGEISYETHITLFSGSQPTRFDLASGLGRRFVFIYFIPTAQEQQKLKICRRVGKGVRGNIGLLKKITNDIIDVGTAIKQVKGIEFSRRFDDAINDLSVPHYIEPLFERIGIGYNIATGNIKDVIEVEYTAELGQMMEQAKQWRLEIAMGAEEGQAIRILQDLSPMDEHELKTHLLDFGLSYGRAEEIIKSLIHQRRVKREGSTVTLEDKWKKMKH